MSIIPHPTSSAPHPEVQALLQGMAAANSQSTGPPSIQTMRAGIQAQVDAAKADPSAFPVEELARVDDITLPGPTGPIPVRVYRPNSDPSPQPALVFFHGGGFCVCSVDTHDPICRRLARLSGVVVLSVDYRLAPEHKFPAAVEDALAATQAVAHRAAELGLDAKRLAVGGDSAGGTLAAVVSQVCRDKGGPALAMQVLIYPWLDPLCDNESKRTCAKGYYCDLPLLDMMWSGYACDPVQDGKNPLAAPALCRDLTGLPHAVVVTAEFDPLRDEGLAYAQRLQQAGVACEYKCYEGMIHGFFSHAFGAPLETGHLAMKECAEAMGRVLGAKKA